MFLRSVLFLSTCTALAVATPVRRSDHVVHEKRNELPHGWQKRERLGGDAIIPLRIGLKQSNLHLGPSLLDEVADPRSSKYGQHWTADEVARMFAPSDETVAAVTKWLLDSGIAAERVQLSDSKSWITVDTSIAEAEHLLNAEYHRYEKDGVQSHIATDQYHLPHQLSANHIDMIMPTLHFDVLPSTEEDRGLAKREVSDLGTDAAWMPKKGPTISQKNLAANLSSCDTQIIPDCLRSLYGFGPGTTAVAGNSYAIVEYGSQAYRGADLDLFFGKYSTNQVGRRPIFDSIDGGYLSNSTSFGTNGESNLDLEFAMALVYPQNVTLYQAGDPVVGASFNNFLDGIDASYCTASGGDDPNKDSKYPDPANGGYKSKDCGRYNPTNVISTSYGYNEADLTPAYEARQCNEYMKLGLMGVTVVYSSGDYGVAGNGGTCLPNNRFNPAFPASCPYITSIGATQVPKGTDITTATHPETACETVIYSGGGFSNNFAMPSYQSAAVKSYLVNYPPPYTAAQYNNSGTTRGYPDVSANGANYVVAIDGNFTLVYGTSASAPTFGSVITLINEQRIGAGKKSVGFINPVLYAHPEVMNDVLTGGNQGCGTAGFSSAPGWDPVTGLGTPNFPAMLKLFMNLP